jgi:hypothetical protein
MSMSALEVARWRGQRTREVIEKSKRRKLASPLAVRTTPDIGDTSSVDLARPPG